MLILDKVVIKICVVVVVVVVVMLVQVVRGVMVRKLEVIVLIFRLNC